ncbi:MAG: ribbon-helix-helix domain-containing protein, partial [Thermosphaera sp.]
MVKEVLLGVRVEREVYEALKIMARAKRVKTSVIVREALSMYLAAAFFFAYPRLAGVFSEAKPTAVRTPPSSQQRVPTAVETTPIGTRLENAPSSPASQAAVP